jgi:hypothetical protein
MNTKGTRAAIYLRVSRDDQTTENQRLVLARLAEHRGWQIVQTYEDQGISGAKGRDQRPAFDAMLKDAVRRRYDILLVWSIDRLGRQQFSMRLSRGRGDGGESGMQQSALNQLAAAKSGFARTPEWDSWRSCLRSIRCSDHCEGAWTGSRTSAAA